MMIWTLTVTVTPAATAATISKKKTAPMTVVTNLLGTEEVVIKYNHDGGHEVSRPAVPRG